MSEGAPETLAKVMLEIVRAVVKEELQAVVAARKAAQPPANGGTQPAQTQQAQSGPRPPMRVCPKCGSKAVIKDSYDETGKGFVCWKGAKPKNGCGTKYRTEAELSSQREPEPQYEEQPEF